MIRIARSILLIACSIGTLFRCNEEKHIFFNDIPSRTYWNINAKGPISKLPSDYLVTDSISLNGKALSHYIKYDDKSVKSYVTYPELSTENFEITISNDTLSKNCSLIITKSDKANILSIIYQNKKISSVNHFGDLYIYQAPAMALLTDSLIIKNEKKNMIIKTLKFNINSQDSCIQDDVIDSLNAIKILKTHPDLRGLQEFN